MDRRQADLLHQKVVTPWEELIQRLQNWDEGFFTAKNKVKGGVCELRAPIIKSAFELSGMENKQEFKMMVEETRMGRSYVRERDEVEKEYLARREKLYEDEPESFTA